MLDSIGLHYDIDPVFYWHHFDTSEAQEFKDAQKKTASPPRNADTMELSHLAYEHASIMFNVGDTKPSDGPNTSMLAVCSVVES